MQKIIALIFVFIVSVNQLHVLDTLLSFQKTYNTKETSNYADSEESDSEKEDSNKEILLHFSPENSINENVCASKISFIFFHPIYSNPYYKKDIKPPCLV